MGASQSQETPVSKIDVESKSNKKMTYFNKNRTINMADTLRVQKGLTLKANLISTLGGKVNVREAVKLPPEEDLNEWLAINTFLFYDIATNVFQTCDGICTKESCPAMVAGPKFTYLWADGKKIKKPIACSAPEYIEYMFEWIFEQISDPSVFPQDDNARFPKSFQKVVKQIFKRMFRLYGHLFHSHFNQLQQAGCEAYLNSSFKHFIYFALEFNLIEENELTPLKSLIKILQDKDT